MTRDDFSWSHGIDFCQQNHKTKGLSDIIISAGIIARDYVNFLVTGS